MKVSKRWRLLAVLFALTLAAAACSSSDDDDVASGDGGDSSSQSDGDGDSSGDNGSSDGGGDTADLGDLFSGDCQEAIAAFGAVQASFASSFGGSFGADGLEDAGDALDELADAAPDDIQSAFQVLADELGAYFDAIAGMDLTGLASGQPDPEVIAALQAASESVDQEALENASNEIEAYFDGKCEG